MARRVIVGLSGGVDSAVAAHLLLAAGHQVEGLFMSNWEEDEDGYCTSAADFQDARRIADELGIELHRVSFAAEYRDRVFAHFLAEYAAGRTPNPDVLCNREIKFGICLDYARRLGADSFATGHYAQTRPGPTGMQLLRGADAGKDQSYFLHAVPGVDLEQVLFPVGALPKTEVRDTARRLGLSVWRKRDSTGICFIGERPFRQFLATYLPARPGPIESPAGEHLGEHHGLMYYTLGQRAGLGIGGRRGAPDAPWYVGAKDLARNVLIAVQGHDHPLLLSTSLATEPVAWVAGAPPAPAFECTVKVRYRQMDVPAQVVVTAGGGAVVEFRDPERAVTPGQYAVFYSGAECLGGAVISAIHGVATRAAA